MPFYGNKENFISLILFVDEVTFSKSSNNNRIYAILCQIAELPEIVRYSYKNIIPLLFFVGSHSNFNILFRKYNTQLEFYLNEKNILNINSKEYNIRIYCLIADASARAKVLNINQINGDFGCFHCMHPGENLRLGKHGNKRVCYYDSYTH